MAKQRVQVNVPQAGTILSPKAAPVDTYYTPNVPLPAQDNSLLQLAEGLRAFTPGASQLIDRLHTDKVEADSDAGAASVSRYENQAAFKKAVDEGQIPRAASPWFQKARRLQQQRLAAEEYTSALNTAYAASNLQNFDDPQALRDFAASFTSTYVKEKGIDQDEREFTQVFAPAAANAQSQLLSRHAQQRMAAIEQEVTESTEREVGLIIQNDYTLNGVGAGTAERIKATVDEMHMNGLSGTVANDVIAKAVIREAEEKGDSSILDLLDQIPSGSGMVGQVGRVRDLRKAAEARIWQATHERQSSDAKAAKLFTEQRSKELMGSAMQKVIEAPDADIKAELSEMAAVDPDKVNTLRSFKAAWIGDQDNRTEDAEASAELVYRVNSGQAQMPEILQAYTRGDINQTTLKKLAADLPRAEQMRTVLGNPIIAETSKAIGAAIRGNEYDYKPEAAIKATQAQGQFWSAMNDWMAKNPDATQRQIIDEAGALRDSLFKAYVPENLEGASNRPLNAEAAMFLPRESVDWTQQPLYGSLEELKQARDEYNQLGPDSQLGRLMGHLGIGDPNQFNKAQKAILARGQEEAQPKK